MSTPKGRAGGVLPINASATRKAPSSQAQKSAPRAPAARLRLIVRRLPPGLVEAEFWSAIGADWEVGGGKVDWAAYKAGKVSKDPAKPSRPARAYLKVREQPLIQELLEKVKDTKFQDAKNTIRDPCLVGPPSLEFAPFNKVPSGRVRHDGRQGTIDQDPEFIDFLRSLTEPITKGGVNGTESAEAKTEKVTTTPLVEYIKEKKANKAKEKEAAALAKAAKSKETKESKDSKDVKASKSETRTPVVVKKTQTAAEKARVAKATQDTVKAINRSVAAMQGKNTTPPEPKPVEKAAATPPQPPTTPRERPRPSATAAARMLQRDLGLTPKEPRSPRTPRAVPITEKETSSKAAASASSQTPTSPQVSKAAPAAPSETPPTGPRATRPANPPPVKANAQTVTRPSKPLPEPSPGAKSAFLKHANPSQGVTEELLKAAFDGFGTVTRCEIDKKKGLAYVDFTDTDALRKAMHASPLKIGSGQVVVLENRNPSTKKITPQTSHLDTSTAVPAATTSAATAPATAAAPQSKILKEPGPEFAETGPIVKLPPPTPVVALPEAAATSLTSTSTTPASPQPPPATPPTAPRATARAGGSIGRSGRGGPFNTPRGNFAPGNRGGHRGAFRGGRGNLPLQPGRGGRGASPNPAPAGASASASSPAPAQGS